ncbi:helix-turn-helix domain-containing protein [Pseudoduganella sp. FT26W]|uniref:Helix-turn-helix domain-containing protein n=1 Tax=Duganella aquatilis TaxID=2666082 RepID=A0A844CSE2_9BURK|nr:AraC family transcriptional regulator [Duganella aquatilis]MRW83667.1 helix-turn-helix domain-containing protein [Duganella aquatilis]
MADPLSDVLNLLNARSMLSTALVAGAAWSVRVREFEGLKFNAVLRGDAWLQVDGEAALHLREGDCFMLARGRSFVIASDLALTPREAAEVFAGAANGIAFYGDRCHILGGKMVLDAAVAPLLVDALPAVIHLPAAAPRAQTMHWLLARLANEMAQQEAGGEVQARQLMQMMFIELMREHLASSGAKQGWFGALADAGLRRALQAMHAEPARAWSLPELAERAHMSRSGFAARFKAVVGVPPLDYLIRWRMHLASHALRNGAASVAEVAAAAGYASESAFGNAFKRVLGQPPKRYLASRISSG